MTAGWHSWGRQITLDLFELTKHPSLPLRRGKTTSPGFSHILFIPFYPFLLSRRTPLSFIQPFILLFHNPCPSYIPHPFNILFIPFFVPEDHWSAPGQCPAAVSRTMQRFINVSPSLAKTEPRELNDIK